MFCLPLPFFVFVCGRAPNVHCFYEPASPLTPHQLLNKNHLPNDFDDAHPSFRFTLDTLLVLFFCPSSRTAVLTRLPGDLLAVSTSLPFMSLVVQTSFYSFICVYFVTRQVSFFFLVVAFFVFSASFYVLLACLFRRFS
jgi:hypothetical protein